MGESQQLPVISGNSHAGPILQAVNCGPYRNLSSRSGVGTMQVALLPKIRYLDFATRLYMKSLTGLGTTIKK